MWPDIVAWHRTAQLGYKFKTNCTLTIEVYSCEKFKIGNVVNNLVKDLRKISVVTETCYQKYVWNFCKFVNRTWCKEVYVFIKCQNKNFSNWCREYSVQLCLHLNHFRARIYRNRSTEYLPVSVISRDGNFQNFRDEIWKGITSFGWFKTSDVVLFIQVYRPPSNVPFTSECIMLLNWRNDSIYSAVTAESLMRADQCPIWISNYFQRLLWDSRYRVFGKALPCSSEHMKHSCLQLWVTTACICRGDCYCCYVMWHFVGTAMSHFEC
jgi:hypothetical protein